MKELRGSDLKAISRIDIQSNLWNKEVRPKIETIHFALIEQKELIARIDLITAQFSFHLLKAFELPINQNLLNPVSPPSSEAYNLLRAMVISFRDKLRADPYQELPLSTKSIIDYLRMEILIQQADIVLFIKDKLDKYLYQKHIYLDSPTAFNERIKAELIDILNLDLHSHIEDGNKSSSLDKRPSLQSEKNLRDILGKIEQDSTLLSAFLKKISSASKEKKQALSGFFRLLDGHLADLSTFSSKSLIKTINRALLDNLPLDKLIENIIHETTQNAKTTLRLKMGRSIRQEKGLISLLEHEPGSLDSIRMRLTASAQKKIDDILDKLSLDVSFSLESPLETLLDSLVIYCQAPPLRTLIEEKLTAKDEEITEKNICKAAIEIKQTLIEAVRESFRLVNTMGSNFPRRNWYDEDEKRYYESINPEVLDERTRAEAFKLLMDYFYSSERTLEEKELGKSLFQIYFTPVEESVLRALYAEGINNDQPGVDLIQLQHKLKLFQERTDKEEKDHKEAEFFKLHIDYFLSTERTKQEKPDADQFFSTHFIEEERNVLIALYQENRSDGKLGIDLEELKERLKIFEQRRHKREKENKKTEFFAQRINYFYSSERSPEEKNAGDLFFAHYFSLKEKKELEALYQKGIAEGKEEIDREELKEKLRFFDKEREKKEKEDKKNQSSSTVSLLFAQKGSSSSLSTADTQSLSSSSPRTESSKSL